MPELPEVQTVVNFLTKHIVGKSILSIKSPNKYTRVFGNGTLNDCNQFIIQKSIVKITRRGKYMVMHLSSGYLLIHLRMTGKLVYNLENESDLKYVSAKFTFEDESELYFKDVRKFGRIYFCKNLDWLEDKLGIEPLSDQFTPKWLQTQLQTKKRMMKPLLLDQSFIAGLGNIYVDEALWLAGIHPLTLSYNVPKKKGDILCFAIKDILSNAINQKGTTFLNFSFGNNNTGNFKNELKIFGKENLPCPKCGNPIQKIKVAQRGTHFCKKCQPR